MNVRNRPLPKVPARSFQRNFPANMRGKVPARSQTRGRQELPSIKHATHGARTTKTPHHENIGGKTPLNENEKSHARTKISPPPKPSPLRQYIASRRSMGRCQAVLAFLAVCGVAILVLTLVFHARARKLKLEEKIKVQQSTTASPLGGRSERECSEVLTSDPDVVTYRGEMTSQLNV